VPDIDTEPLATLSIPFVSWQDDLVKGTSGCMELGGLYPAVEMVGSGARIGTLQANALQCANPSQFQTAPMGTATLTSDSLGVPDRYGGAHVGSPSLGSSYNNATDTARRWDLFLDATNDPPDLADDVGARVGYAIAHARTATFGALPADWTTSSTPRLGGDPPSCLVSGDTCSEPSVREPFLLLRRGADDVLSGNFTLAFAAQLPGGGHELRVDSNVSPSPNTPLTGSGEPLLASVAECDDLRDPALVPVRGGSGGYWLFFTCVPADGVGEIRAVRLDDDLQWWETRRPHHGGWCCPRPSGRSQPAGSSAQSPWCAAAPRGSRSSSGSWRVMPRGTRRWCCSRDSSPPS
jgi:hypothetical protein